MNHADLEHLRAVLHELGPDGCAPQLHAAMRRLGCKDEHETMLALIDTLLGAGTPPQQARHAG